MDVQKLDSQMKNLPKSNAAEETKGSNTGRWYDAGTGVRLSLRVTGLLE